MTLISDLDAGEEVDNCPENYTDAITNLYNKRTIARDYYVKFTESNPLYKSKLTSKMFSNIYDANVEFVRTFIVNEKTYIKACETKLDNKISTIVSYTFAQQNYKMVDLYKKEILRCESKRKDCVLDKKLFESL